MTINKSCTKIDLKCSERSDDYYLATDWISCVPLNIHDEILLITEGTRLSIISFGLCW